jgi:N-acetylglutamate synthase-like GNAT family acetyltransferase
MNGELQVRAARPGDIPSLEALLAPEVAAGTILPRVVVAEDFLVAELRGAGIVGAVATSMWTEDVVELGSLVSARGGLGIGRMLVEAVMQRAALAGFRSVVALTGLNDWFGRLGFVSHPTRPWALARRQPVLLTSCEPHVDAAVGWKASTVCSGCSRLSGCSQALMVRAVPAIARQVA